MQKRQNQILEMFHGNDALQVSDVSQILRVSEITIRRDFDYLEKKGYITRFHGGATLNTSREGISPYTEGSPLLHSREKQMIALAVSSLLEDNQTVFMNAGTTILEIFKAVRSKHMRIVSNSALAGSVIEAMCDEYDPETGTARGRAYFDSPGVDGSVVFPGPCMPGSIVQLRVLSAEDGELRCELI